MGPDAPVVVIVGARDGGGVALGAWLTVVGEAGAPGAAAIDPGIDFLALPLGAAGAVFIVHLAVQLVVASWRGTRNTPRE
jgi:hypothetical protein